MHYDSSIRHTEDIGTKNKNLLTQLRSLATSGHGTALGIIRSLHKMNYLDHAYCTETRPYNQGSRLTAFELVYEKIPATLITDSMAGALFARLKEEKKYLSCHRRSRQGRQKRRHCQQDWHVLACCPC